MQLYKCRVGGGLGRWVFGGWGNDLVAVRLRTRLGTAALEDEVRVRMRRPVNVLQGQTPPPAAGHVWWARVVGTWYLV